MAAAAKKYDVVLMGATGYTGRLTAQYLAEHYTGQIKWAIAGRSLSGLEMLKDDLVNEFNVARESVGIVVANSLDHASLASLVRSTRVVLSAAGPFWKVGTPLVEECVKAGVHYCDITGETVWAREIIDKFHQPAIQSGAKIVPFCGFDCVPSDLGCMMMAQEMRRRHGCGCKQVTMYVGPTRGGVSGGTCASMVNLVDRPLGEALGVMKRLRDPYLLNPAGTAGPAVADRMGVGYDADMKMLTAPWLMAGVNTRVVRRSNGLLNSSYGAQMVYSEALTSKPTALGLFTSLAVSITMPLLMLMLLVPPLRALLKMFLPKQGSGPSLESRKRGFFNFVFVAKGDSTESPVLRGAVNCKRDAYTATAIMVAESAVCLVKDEARLDKAGGVLTPAVAMKGELLKRLNAAGVVFTVDGAEPRC